MIKNRIGTSDIFVSPLTLGCMSLGTDKNEAKKMIHQAISHGINHLDTADLYDFGRNEEIVGHAIKDKRNEITLTTKVGNHFDRKTQRSFWDPSKKHIEQALQDSLQRLQTDYIDLYLLHGGTIDDDIDETIETFEKLKKTGVIRAYGISSIRPNVIAEYVKRSNIDVVMMQYSMLDRRPEQLFPLLKENGVSVLARGPLAKGILSTDAVNQLQMKGNKGLLEYNMNELNILVNELLDLNEPITELAFQYVLSDPIVTSAVFGASTMQQLKENIQYFNKHKMHDSLYEFIKNTTKKSVYTSHQIPE